MYLLADIPRVYCKRYCEIFLELLTMNKQNVPLDLSELAQAAKECQEMSKGADPRVIEAAREKYAEFVRNWQKKNLLPSRSALLSAAKPAP
jgi:hypothetical protein